MAEGGGAGNGPQRRQREKNGTYFQCSTGETLDWSTYVLGILKLWGPSAAAAEDLGRAEQPEIDDVEGSRPLSSRGMRPFCLIR